MVGGTLFLLGSSFFFAIMGMMIKLLDGRIPLFQLSFLRSSLALVPLFFLMKRLGVTFRSPQWPLLSLRGIWGLLAMLFYFWALANIPLAPAVMLNYSSPIFTTLFASCLLGEKVTRVGIICLTVALLGLVCILKPFDGRPEWGYFLALGAGIFSGAAFTTVKHLTVREPPWRIVWYYNFIASLGALPVAVSNWVWRDVPDLLLLLAISLAGTTGQIFLTEGFLRCSASEGSVVTLSIVVFTSLGGWFFWGEVPDFLQFLGMMAVLGGILGITKSKELGIIK